MKRHLITWLGATLALLAIIGTANALIDPYGMFRSSNYSEFAPVKPTAGEQGPMVKSYQVLKTLPKTLILGNSRAEVGFNPEYEGWPISWQPVFNLALPGTGTKTTLNYLQHVLNNAKLTRTSMPKQIVWGLDFSDFLTNSEEVHQAVASENSNRRLILDASSTSIGRELQLAKDYAQVTLTMAALLNSFETLLKQRESYSANLTVLGFNPMRDYIKISAEEGYWTVVRQKDIANIRGFLNRPANTWKPNISTSTHFSDFNEILKLCRENKIDLHMLIYPYHAHYLEVIRITGHWPSLSLWKQELVKIMDRQAQTYKSSRAVLWDFNELNAYTQEAVPVNADRNTKMQWYWEAGHFKQELGNLLLDQMLHAESTTKPLGVRLTSANLKSRLTLLDEEEYAYRLSHLDEISALEKITAQLRP
jgi:hypothetical protein